MAGRGIGLDDKARRGRRGITRNGANRGKAWPDTGTAWRVETVADKAWPRPDGPRRCRAWQGLARPGRHGATGCWRDMTRDGEACRDPAVRTWLGPAWPAWPGTTWRLGRVKAGQGETRRDASGRGRRVLAGPAPGKPRRDLAGAARPWRDSQLGHDGMAARRAKHRTRFALSRRGRRGRGEDVANGTAGAWQDVTWPAWRG